MPTAGVAPARRRRLALWVVAVAALGGVVLALVLRSAGTGPGPLYVAEANRLANPQPVNVPFAYGIPVVFNRADDPVELRGVSLARATPGLELLRVYASGPRRRYEHVSTDPDKGFPGRRSPFTDLHPLSGYRVAPAHTRAGRLGVNIVLILRAPRAGRFGFRGVRVESRHDGKTYRATFPNAYVACAGPFDAAAIARSCRTGPPGIGRVRPSG